MKKVHSLFRQMPASVQNLRKQAEQEQRQKSRQEFWANQTQQGGFKPLPKSNKAV